MITNEQVIQNIKDWFGKNKITKAVINISGGADSTYVAWVLVKALGKENVIGLLQPNGEQKDISYAKQVVELLDIKHNIINIKCQYDNTMENISDKSVFTNETGVYNAKINIAPRLRMVNAYAVANAVCGAVVGTGNASERYIGFFTKWGDGACDFNPIKNICKTDLIQMGLELGIPEKLICKTPSDGLTGLTDEQKYGFTYKVLDEYIKTGKWDNEEIKEKIDRMHKNSRHKFEEI